MYEMDENERCGRAGHQALGMKTDLLSRLLLQKLKWAICVIKQFI